jgi:uncharacterized integral membrane protein
MKENVMDSTTAGNHAGGRSLIGLFSDLWRETSTLVREEAELARAEISEKVSQVETAVTSLAVGAAVLFAGLLVLLFAAVAALAQVLPPDSAVWLAPLIVGIIVAALGAILLAKGRHDLRAGSLKPTRSAQSLSRDAEFAREHLR